MMQWNHTIQITRIKCFPLYIYCTETLMGVLPCANNEIGGGISAYIIFVTVKTVGDCYPFNKNYCVNHLKTRNVSEKTCEAEKTLGIKLAL